MDEKKNVSQQWNGIESVKLIIDFGNTFVKIAVFQGIDLVFHEAVEILTIQRLQELERTYHFKSAIISAVSIVPSGVRDFLEKQYIFIELSHQTSIPIVNRYLSPETLGKDRLAVAVAAAGLYPARNCLVIDAGTCITYDIIDKEKNYLGGSISPGIQLRFKALNTFTSRLPLVPHGNFEGLTGTTTEESIQSGVINGTVAEIDGIIDQYEKIFPRLKVLVTGGDMNFFAKKLKSNIFAVPNLVLIGLNEILNYNFEKR
jgi:type III pantothenate kinase